MIVKINNLFLAVAVDHACREVLSSHCIRRSQVDACRRAD
jgi:hypothetical protein